VRVSDRKVNGKFAETQETTVGRVLLMEVVPKEVDFNLVNQVLTKKRSAR
jgi:hypothetical protein